MVRFLYKEVVGKELSGRECVSEEQEFDHIHGSTVTDLFEVGEGLHEIVVHDIGPAPLADGTVATGGTVYVRHL